MDYLSFHCDYTYTTGFRLDARFSAGAGVTALFGASGSGKSTVLALIAGLLRPTHGVISLGDRTLTETSARLHLPPEDRRVGLLFQNHCLLPHLTVRGNLEYGMKRRSSGRFRFDEIVGILELGDVLTRQPHELSGGQKQRVALGRALLSGPELLMLDEPFSGLDEPLQDRILEYLRRVLSEYRVPTLLVTHTPAHVHQLAGHVIHLDAGRVIATGSPAEVLGARS
ncbi:Sulfate/thiosulfate import ATP-binding protein CysA [Maioricimonas rarisocia]|uniref:Sulfate/thiosulfate import ATP-binding protein CysA n=1 Tax=Maioricimonas rarisocia TaxID=2528026 RepID=A0A517ZDQ1_9PLAN|nr:ATP-binding cassette domain-containing protein [Maioricimonas rarisocia]QDU40606.1 Sulfate/thiosulfate import ATP-binding protein CysA [Maioricimonas rarisocia]